MIWLTIFVVLFVLIYYKIIKPLSYWKERGVPHLKPLPLVGNSGALLFKTKSVIDYVADTYSKFSKNRYYGIHQFNEPALFIRDLNLIKMITVKDFDHFVDRHSFIIDDMEPLIGKNLVNLKGQKWRDMRTTLSPSFTSSKMKSMFKLLCESAQQFTQYFEKCSEGYADVEMKDIFTRFTNDVIASIAFGLKCDSLTERNNEFYMTGKNSTTFPAIKVALFSALNTMPFLKKIIKIKLLPTKTSLFFQNVITENIRKRTEEGLVRFDMIHLLLEARKGIYTNEEQDIVDTGFATVEESSVLGHTKNPKFTLTDEDITAQALIFFLGGFETSSTLMTFLSYELAINQDIHRKLQNEIDETLTKCNGELTYDALNKMKYMDMVVSETLRKWPPSFQLNRECIKDYIIKSSKPDEDVLIIKKGSIVLVPVAGLHRDEQYFKDPLRFDPERFNDQNKTNIKPYSYLPFGSGPRSCIASRFALMENKTIIFYLLSKFNLVTTSKTQIPLKLGKGKFNLSAENGLWLRLEKRKVK